MSTAYGACKLCDRKMRIHGRGLCATCYTQKVKDDTLHLYPRSYPSHREQPCTRCDQRTIWAAGMCRTCFKQNHADGNLMIGPDMGLPDQDTPNDPDWASRAACKSMDPELFFTDVGGNLYPEEAVNACRRCQVRHDCLEKALREEENYGLWGGMSEQQRRALQKRTRQVAV